MRRMSFISSIVSFYSYLRNIFIDMRFFQFQYRPMSVSELDEVSFWFTLFYMVNLLYLLLFTVFASPPPIPKINFVCEKTNVTYFVDKIKTSFEIDICKNHLGQFFSKNCADGCKFLSLLNNKEFLKITTDGYGSPGGQICRKLGFSSKIVEFSFKGSKIENISLCFLSDKNDTLVSTGFLFDLSNNIKAAP